MRDGVKLHAVVLRPRTPTTVPSSCSTRPAKLTVRLQLHRCPLYKLALSGYVFVIESIRGRYSPGSVCHDAPHRVPSRS